MHPLIIVLFVLAGCCIIYNIVVQLMICDFLKRRGRKVSIIFLRIMIFSYIAQYKSITRQESGRTGPLFYHAIVSINAALLFAVLGIIGRAVLQGKDQAARKSRWQ